MEQLIASDGNVFEWENCESEDEKCIVIRRRLWTVNGMILDPEGYALHIPRDVLIKLAKQVEDILPESEAGK